MKTNRAGRPAGARNTRLSKEAVTGYYALLRSAADAGDVNAAAKLIELHERKQQESAQ